DVTFSPRVGAPPATGPEVLEVPQPQTATIVLGGFEGIKKKEKFTGKVYNPSLNATAPPQEISALGSTGIQFFAGEVDDPFFFDIPAFSRFVASVRAGAPDTSVFARARDSFAGYNALSVALSVPVDLLKGDNGNIVGVNFVAQRRQVEQPTKDGTVKSIGVFRNVDRIATPGVNVALVPFSRKNEYNAATPADDAAGTFVGADESPKTPLGIADTLLAFGTPSDNIGILASVAVAKGDILKLDTSVANTDTNGSNGGGGDNAEGSFPNGRRLGDDVIDIVLSIIADTTLGDGVNASDVAPQAAFPFVALPQQPRDSGVDDSTRN
ncbi:MAG TPA: DUF4331 family protein, partial [Chthoniobacteraceae bacterium]|nr:DUF4331 family protein [Chthoniobacteraceae bacterium]